MYRIGIFCENGSGADGLRHILRDDRYECLTFGPDQNVLDVLATEALDLVILDSANPIGRLDILASLPRVKPGLRVLLLSERHVESEVLTLLASGVDEYLAKPVSPSMLMAKARALLRRTAGSVPRAERVSFGRYVFEPATRQVWISTVGVRLTEKQYEFALLLFRNLSKPLTRTYIRQTVWRQSADVTSRTIDTHASTLRTKLKLRPQNGFLLAPVGEFGFCLERLPNDIKWPGMTRDAIAM
jgi:two-component system, OmpR family, response regulator